jgi:hypothetical protein
MLLLICLASVAAGCGLECFLGNLTVILPNITEKEISLTNIICSDLELTGLQSSSAPSVLSLSVQQLALSCKSNWEVKVSKAKLGEGTIAFRVDLSVSFDLSFSSTGGSGRFPTGVQVSDITNSFAFSEFVVHAKNPIENWIIHLLTNFTAKEVTKELDKLNGAILQDLAGDISSNLAALSVELEAPVQVFRSPLFPHSEEYLSLTKSTPVIRLLDFVLNTAVGVDGPINVNYLIRSFLRNATSIDIASLLGNRTIMLAESIGGVASFDLSVLSGVLAGIDSFNLFQLFVPASENFFSSQLQLRSIALSNFSFSMQFQFDGSESLSVSDPVPLTETISLDLALSDFGVNFSNVLLISSGLELRGAQYLDKGCVGTAVENVTVVALNVAGQLKRLLLGRGGGGSNNDPLDTEVGLFLNNFFAAIDSSYPSFVPGVVSLALRDPITAQINSLLESLVHNPGGNMSSCGLYSEERDGFWAEFPLPTTPIIASFSGVGGAVLLLLIVACACAMRKRRGSSLFLSPVSLWYMRVLIPIAFFCSLGTFVVVMCGTTGFSTLVLTFNETEIALPPVFLFNLPNLLMDAIQAQAWANVIGLSVLGMFWMFARQVLMLLLFFVPMFKKRAVLIELLDLLGKWVGFFFLEAVLIPIAFRLHIEPVAEVSFDLFTSGAAAYFLYILGLFLSIAAGNIMSTMARNQGRSVQDQLLAENTHSDDERSREPRVWLGGHVFVLNNRRVRLKLWVQATLSILVIACLGLTIASVAVECVAFTLTGLASRLLPLIGTPLTRSYSVISIVTDYGTIVQHVVWMYVTQVCVFVTCIVLPISCCLSYLVIWFVPLRESGRLNMMRLVMVLRSWNFLEVLVGALLACTLSISLIGTFMVQDECNFVNQLLVQYFSVDLGGETFCYDVETIPLTGFWLMLATVLLSFVTGQVLVVLARTSEAQLYATTEEELEVMLKTRKQSWLDMITEQVDPKAFRTDLQ